MIPKRLRGTLAVVALSILPYAPSLGGDFVYDDVALIVDDRRVGEGAFVEALRTPYWAPPRQSGLYRPVTTLSYVLNASLEARDQPLSPLPFRAVNLALHVIASLIALALARRVLGSETAALAAAIVFAVHPIHAEVVANVIGRAESLGFVLAGGAWWVAVPAARERRFGTLALASALATLGVLAKENALGLVLAAPLEVLLLRSKSGERRPSERHVADAATAFVPAVIAVMLALAARVAFLGASTLTPATVSRISWVMNPLAQEPLATRLANAPLLLVEYARHFVWPIALAPDYAGRFLPLVSSFQEPRAIVRLVGAVAIMLGPPLASRRHGRALLFASALVLLTLGPVLQAIPIGTLLGDRLCYAASFGWSLVAGVAVASLLERFGRASGARLGVALVAGALALVTTFDARAWGNMIELFRRARPRVPGAVQVPLVLSQLLIDQNHFEEAEPLLREALVSLPEMETGGAVLMLGRVEHELKRNEDARRDLERGLELIRKFPESSWTRERELAAHVELSNALKDLGDYKACERELAIACRFEPDPLNLANLGFVRFALKEYAGAKDAFEKSLRAKPDQARADEIRKDIAVCDEKLK